MSEIIRTARDTDWAEILSLANKTLPLGEKENEEWLQNRQGFDRLRFIRRHYVAEDRTTRELVAYCAIEEGPEKGDYRVFLVVVPDIFQRLGERMYLQLIRGLRELGAKLAWAREEIGDPVVDFLKDHGFEESSQFTLPNGREAVVLSKQLS